MYSRKATLKTISEIIEDVKRGMLGRMADEQGGTALMAETALCDGDHLEIGSLHGGSAIVVALLKKEMGYSGRVVCIDPFDGYYPKSPRYYKVDILTKVPVTVDVIRENARRFGVELEIVQAYSHPFPIQGRRFATAYIDGDHWGEMPLRDWENVSPITDKFITFDNCDFNHPDVLLACKTAERIWKPYKREGITCILQSPY
jgi:hypothetical protein